MKNYLRLLLSGNLAVGLGLLALLFYSGIAQAEATLSINQTGNSATAYTGQDYTYTIDYANTDVADATNVLIKEIVPNNTTWVADTDWICGGSTPGSECVYTIGTLPAGASGGIIFVVKVDNTVPISTTLINNARIFQNSTVLSGEQTLNTAVEIPDIDLRITKTGQPILIQYLGNLQYTVTLTNNSTLYRATNIRVSDLLPIGVNWQAAQISTGSYDTLTGLWQVAELLPQQRPSLAG